MLTKHDQHAMRTRRVARSTAMSTPRHTSTPIRRISRGSLTAASGRAHEPTPLSFLQNEALPILTEETHALQDNLEQMGEIEHALTTFNENFAMFLYGLKMNAFCVEWPEAPVEESLCRHEAQRAAGRRTQKAAPTWTSPPTSGGTGDQTYVTEAESPEAPRPRARMNAGGRAASQARARAAHAASARASQARPPPTDPRASQSRSAPSAEARAASVGKQRIPVATKRKREVRAARAATRLTARSLPLASSIPCRSSTAAATRCVRRGCRTANHFRSSTRCCRA